MTRFQEFPLRPQGQPWPGLNTRGGRLDPGTGQLEDGSFNAIINEADILEKRKGFIRGLDERFSGPVCGLFRYTDNCGVEYLVVADQDGVHVRTPFDIPTYLGSDSIPNDDFDEATVNSQRWSNTDDYETYIGSLRLKVTAAMIATAYVPLSRLMQWFKTAALTSYKVEIEYAFNVAAHQQVCSIAIKQSESSWLQANVVIDGSTYYATLQLATGGGTARTTLGTQELSGATLGGGFLRLSYVAETRTATVRVVPSGGDQVTFSATLNELQDSALGQDSSIGIVVANGDDAPEILQVTGGAI